MSEIEIKVGQIWEHSSGEFSAEVIGVCYDDGDVELIYSDNDESEWISFNSLRTDYFLPEEEHHVLSVDDAEAAFRASQVEPVAIKQNTTSFEDAEAMFTGAKQAPMSDMDAAEAAYSATIGSPLSPVKNLVAPTSDLDLMVLGII